MKKLLELIEAKKCLESRLEKMDKALDVVAGGDEDIVVSFSDKGEVRWVKLKNVHFLPALLKTKAAYVCELDTKTKQIAKLEALLEEMGGRA